MSSDTHRMNSKLNVRTDLENTLLNIHSFNILFILAEKRLFLKSRKLRNHGIDLTQWRNNCHVGYIFACICLTSVVKSLPRKSPGRVFKNARYASRESIRAWLAPRGAEQPSRSRPYQMPMALANNNHYERKCCYHLRQRMFRSPRTSDMAYQKSSHQIYSYHIRILCGFRSILSFFRLRVSLDL